MKWKVLFKREEYFEVEVEDNDRATAEKRAEELLRSRPDAYYFTTRDDFELSESYPTED